MTEDVHWLWVWKVCGSVGTDERDCCSDLV